MGPAAAPRQPLSDHLPAITSDAVFWSAITLLFLVAIAVRRRRSRLLRERWEQEEREDLGREEDEDEPFKLN